MARLLDQCPNCDAMWGIEEMSFQECDACGYPDNEDNEEEGFFYGLDDFDDEEE